LTGRPASPRDEQLERDLLATLAKRASSLVGLSCYAFTRRVRLRLRSERAVYRGHRKSRDLLDEAMAGLVEAAGSAVLLLQQPPEQRVSPEARDAVLTAYVLAAAADAHLRKAVRLTRPKRASRTGGGAR
jgi:hypothetical protein